MPRYYFDFMDESGLLTDDEGVELANSAAAQEEAARSLGDMLRDVARRFKGRAPQGMAITVRDDTGPVMQVRFSFEMTRMN
jgi:uncharacterized protein DUF6894